MNRVREIAAWILALASLGGWIVVTFYAMFALFLFHNFRAFGDSFDASVEPLDLAWLAVFALGWLGLLFLYYCFVRDRSRTRSSRPPRTALLCFLLPAILMLVLVFGLDFGGLAQNLKFLACLLLPLVAGCAAILLLPAKQKTNEVGAWVLAILSVPAWIFGTYGVAQVLMLPSYWWVQRAVEGTPQTRDWGWLGATLLATLIGWVGEIFLWRLLVHHRGAPRPSRPRALAMSFFCVASALFMTLLVAEDPLYASWFGLAIMGPYVVIPHALAATAAFLLPVARRGQAAHDAGGQP
jgi:hypothetical protein